MCDFKVGDKVLCIDGIKSNMGVDLVQGQTYTILEVARCSCGSFSVYVGITIDRDGRTVCRVCGSLSVVGKWFLKPSRFTKIDGYDDSIEVSEFMDIFTTIKKNIDVD